MFKSEWREKCKTQQHLRTCETSVFHSGVR
jgi:hypothetical protein